MNLEVRRQRLLYRGDEVLQRLAREVLAFGSVQIDVVRPHLPLVADFGTPVDANLDVHVLESDQWERLSVGVEPKLERVELRVRRTTEDVTVRRLHVVLCHDRRRQTLGENSVLLVDDLPADDQLYFVDHGAPIGDRRVRLSSIRERRQVHVREEITLAFETHRRHGVRLDLTLDRLSFHRLGEIRVTFE